MACAGAVARSKWRGRCNGSAVKRSRCHRGDLRAPRPDPRHPSFCATVDPLESRRIVLLRRANRGGNPSFVLFAIKAGVIDPLPHNATLPSLMVSQNCGPNAPSVLDVAYYLRIAEFLHIILDCVCSLKRFFVLRHMPGQGGWHNHD